MVSQSIMNKRVHLPPDERREQIVRGAMKIFAEKGFDATTNKEIAKVAGISSTGLIYHYFKDKFALLHAVIEMHMGEAPPPDFPEKLMQMSLEEGLREFIRRPLRNMNNPAGVAFTRVLLGEAMRRPEFAKILADAMISRMFTMFVAFLKHHQEQGTIRRDIDPALTAMRFVGSIQSLFVMREVLRIPEAQALDMEVIEKGLIDDFLQGILPE